MRRSVFLLKGSLCNPWDVFVTHQGKAVESFQRLNFRVIAVGDSFNDTCPERSNKCENTVTRSLQV